MVTHPDFICKVVRWDTLWQIHNSALYWWDVDATSMSLRANHSRTSASLNLRIFPCFVPRITLRLRRWQRLSPDIWRDTTKAAFAVQKLSSRLCVRRGLELAAVLSRKMIILKPNLPICRRVAKKRARWPLFLLRATAIERVSIKCRKTKTKVITLANQKGGRQSGKPIKTRSNYT